MQNETIGHTTENARLILGDCLQILPQLPDGSIDLILCDLPYGTTQNRWDSVIPLVKLWKQYRRLCKGTIVLTAMQPFTSQLVASAPDLFRYDWVWAKNKASGHLNAKKRPMVGHESILVFSDKTPVYNPQKSTGHAPANYAKRTVFTQNYGEQQPSTYDGGNTDRYPTSVLHFPVVNNDSPERFHPTQKPVALMEYLIRTYSDEGDMVLDNCFGSGSTGVAALNAGRKFIGIEQSSEYYTGAVARLTGQQPQSVVQVTTMKPEREPDLFSFTAA